MGVLRPLFNSHLSNQINNTTSTRYAKNNAHKANRKR